MQYGLLLEQSCRMSKTDLRGRPMFHRTKDAIEAHLTHRVHRSGPGPRGSEPHRVGHPQPRAPAPPAALRDHRVNGVVQTIRPAINDHQQALLDALKQPPTHALSE
jgi:hypothetical protein